MTAGTSGAPVEWLRQLPGRTWTWHRQPFRLGGVARHARPRGSTPPGFGRKGAPRGGETEPREQPRLHAGAFKPPRNGTRTPPNGLRSPCQTALVAGCTDGRAGRKSHRQVFCNSLPDTASRERERGGHPMHCAGEPGGPWHQPPRRTAPARASAADWLRPVSKTPLTNVAFG